MYSKISYGSEGPSLLIQSRIVLMYSTISYGSEGPRDVRMWQFEPTSTTVLMYRTYSHGSEGDEVKRITKERLQYSTLSHGCEGCFLVKYFVN